MSGAITIQTPETAELQVTGNDMTTQAQSIVVSNVDDHRYALHFLQGIVTLKRSITERFEPAKKAAHGAHKAICAMEKELTEPLDDARALVTRKVAEYDAAERRRAQEEARVRAEEARRAEEERQIADAIAAEEQGDTEQAELIMDEVIEAPVVTPDVQLAKVTGVSMRSTWRADVTDPMALIRHVAEHPEWVALLTPNIPALNALARSQKGQLSIPGVSAVEERTMSVGTR